MRVTFGRVLDITLVSCALASTVVLVTRSFRSQSPVAAPAMKLLDGWKEELAFDRRIGRADAPFRIVVWTDYQCPACKLFEQQIRQVRDLVKDSLAVAYRYYPLSGHPLAYVAAIAAECARAQGRFEAMHMALFQASLSGSSLPTDSLVAASRVEGVRFRACLADSVAANSVRADLDRARALQLRGTPAVQIGDSIGTGGMMAEELIAHLRRARRWS